MPMLLSAFQRRLIWSSVAAPLALAFLAASAQGQTYTATTLKSAVQEAAELAQTLCLDNAGKVHGHVPQFSLFLALLQAVNGPSGSLSAGNYPRAASWSASPLATVSPLLTPLPTTTYRMETCSSNGVYQVVMNAPISTSAAPAPMGLLKSGKLSQWPNPEGFYLYPRAVNNQGWVVGTTSLNGMLQATVWRDGQASALPQDDWAHAQANDINNEGVIVGTVYRRVAGEVLDEDIQRAAVWRNGALAWVEPEMVPKRQSRAMAINDAGQILIKHTTNAWVYKADLLTNGVATPLSPDKADVAANDINAAGVVVGTAGGRAVMWRNAVETDLTQWVTARGIKLPVGVVLTNAHRINDAGSMVVSYPVKGGRTYLRLNAKP